MAQTKAQKAKSLLVALYVDNAGKWHLATKNNVTHKVILNRTVCGGWTHENIWFIPCHKYGMSGFDYYVADNLTGLIWNVEHIAHTIVNLLNTHRNAQFDIESY